MSDEALHARILDRLNAPDSPYRAQASALVVDHLLAQPLRALLDLDEVRRLVLSALTEGNVRRAVERHVAPGFARHAEAIVSTQVQVGSLVSKVAHDKLRQIAHKLQLPEARWAQAAVDPLLVRRLLAPVWTQVLLNFAKRLPIPGAGGHHGAPAARSGGSGITGFLSRSVQEQAEKLIDRGRSAMGGLGAEVERRLLAAARDFSDGAAQVFRDTLYERLQSDEGRELVGKICVGVIDHVIQTRFADLQPDLDALPMDEVLDLVPDLVAHAAPSTFVQDIVQRELAAWLSLEGERSLGALLHEAGSFDEARAALVRRSEQLSAGLFQTREFADWVTRLAAP
jgi:hypothetical protein